MATITFPSLSGLHLDSVTYFINGSSKPAGTYIINSGDSVSIVSYTGYDGSYRYVPKINITGIGTYVNDSYSTMKRVTVEKGFTESSGFSVGISETKYSVQSLSNSRDIIVTINFKKMYTVTYSTEHGETPSAINAYKLSDDNLPKLSATNFVFLGWYYESSYETKAQIDDVISSNTVLYAKWTPQKALVDLDSLESALTASADAIREKSESTELIDFDMEGGTGFAEAIEAIPAGGPQGEYNIIPILKEDGTQRLQITDSGSFSLKVKTITQNGSYDPTEEDVNGYSSVIVAIPTYDGTVV